MGSFDKKQKTTAKTSGTATTTPNVPGYVPAQDFYTKIGGLLNTSAPAAYGPTANQQAAFTGAANLTGNPAITEGMGVTRGVSTFTPQAVNPAMLRDVDLTGYLNPYTQNVIDATMGDIERARAGAITANQGAATQAKAYGGSRHGVVDAQTNEAALRTAANTGASLRAAGFDSARTAALADIQNKLQADTGNADRDVTGAGLRLAAGGQLGSQGIAADENARSNVTTQAALGEMQRQIEKEADPQRRQAMWLQMIQQLLGINVSDVSGQTINQSGTSSGTSKSSGGMTVGFNWGPFSASYGGG